MYDYAENLERLLDRATRDLRYRSRFYSALINATVYVLGPESPGCGEIMMRPRTLEAGDTMQLRYWHLGDGSRVLPVFTSLWALRAAISEDTCYRAISARELFMLTRGSTLVLNPRQPVGKILQPWEIELLLHQDSIDIEDCELDHPLQYPQRLVEALTRLLGRHPSVRTAWVAQVVPNGDDRVSAHLVVGLEVDGNAGQVLREAGHVVSEYVGGRQILDLCRVRRERDGLDAWFFDQGKPFYERAWGHKMALSPDAIGHA
ncbi:enhanced serine sensitivity protein SseB C-terminal domain-containing protein [Isoalcanivorax indicus]|uniref:enhanced serine sensitivity protein SseB C-terminal domain-containing protein n=1 Tax=Isoalcanivorax indicus TaxID=2202653 RepID=UPI0013C50008|nr:enhanced serine sensitivity protein SseB C-terminal domain-containing protein [Isoalcanivorax indicus]